jgi:hypothetical protein
MRKKIIILLSLSILTMSLIGCSNKKEQIDEPISLGEIKFDEEDEISEEVTTEKNFDDESLIENDNFDETIDEEETIEKKEYYIDFVKNNVSEDIMLNTFSVNGENYILPVNKEDIKTIVICPFATAHVDIKAMYFSGKGWGVHTDKEDPLAYPGSKIFFMQNENEEIIAAKTSTFFDEGDLEIYFSNKITFNTPREDVENYLGKGEEFEDFVFYKNNSGIIAIRYKKNLETRKYYVDEIFCYAN